MSKTEESKALTPLQMQEQALAKALADAPEIPKDLACAGTQDMQDKFNLQLPEAYILQNDEDMVRYEACGGGLGAIYTRHGAGEEVQYELLAPSGDEHALDVAFLYHWRAFEKWRDGNDGSAGPMCVHREPESTQGYSEIRDLCLQFGNTETPYDPEDKTNKLRYTYHHMHYFFFEVQDGPKKGRLFLVGMRGGSIKTAKGVVRKFRMVQGKKPDVPLMGLRFKLYTERHMPKEKGKKSYYRWMADLDLAHLWTPVEDIRRMKGVAEEMDVAFAAYGAPPFNPDATAPAGVQDAEVLDD